MKFNYAILYALFLSVLGYGQVSIVSETNTKEYEINKPFTLNIGVEIEGDLHPQTPVKLPDLSKFEIIGNASEMFSFIDPDNGNLVRQIVYQLIIEPKQSGKIKIGSALIQINGKFYKSEPFDIIVKEKKKRENAFNKEVYLAMETPNPQIYTNEGVKVIVKAYGKNFNNFRKIHHIKLPHHNNIYPIPINHQDIEIENDEIVSQIVASFWVFPDKSGIITLPPVLAKLGQQHLKSNSLKIEALSLPQNAPKSFDNAVGDFNLDIYSPQDNPQINQPIDVFIKLSGLGNWNQIELPNILESDDYQLFEPKKSIKTSTRKGELYGEITKHYVLIPKKEGSINILLDEFSFFNPKTQKYHHYHKNLNLDILPTPTENTENKLEKIIQNSEHILKKVDLNPNVKKEEKSNHNWLVATSILGLLGGVVSIFLWVFRKKKNNNFPKKEEKTEKITTIADTEELLKSQIIIGKDYYFRALQNAVKRNNAKDFFELYEELHQTTEKQILNNNNKDLYQWISEIENVDFSNQFKIFRETMEIEKYNPIHQNLEELYQNIYKFYSKIMK